MREQEKGMVYKMKDYFERPECIKEAAQNQKGLPLALEILVFVGIFIMASLAELVFILPGEMYLMYTNSDFVEAAAAGNQDAIAEISAQISSSNAYSVMGLFANLGLILVVWFSCKIFQRRKMSSLGFCKKDAWKEYVRGALAGLVAFSAAVGICMLTGAVKFEGISETFSIGIFLAFVAGFLIQGMAEEMLCRGYFMVSVARKSTMLVAILTNSLVFACLHLLNTGISVLAFINLTLYGIFASVYFIKRGNIWAPAAFHSIWNLVQGNVYGIYVSGTTNNCKLLESVSVEGKTLWNGGAFGLEGGLAVTIILVVGILFLCTRKAKRQ